MNTKPNAQAKMIAAHLNVGNTIAALEALHNFEVPASCGQNRRPSQGRLEERKEPK